MNCKRYKPSVHSNYLPNITRELNRKLLVRIAIQESPRGPEVDSERKGKRPIQRMRTCVLHFSCVNLYASKVRQAKAQRKSSLKGLRNCRISQAAILGGRGPITGERDDSGLEIGS